jgi:hypothetical protein
MFHTEQIPKTFTLRGAYSRLKYEKTRILVATVYGISKSASENFDFC